MSKDLYPKPKNNVWAFIVGVFAFILAVLIMGNFIKTIKEPAKFGPAKSVKYTKASKPDEIKTFDEKDVIDVSVNYPIPLSYKSKDEIYEIRKKYVKDSIFNIRNYEPSEEVFGSIVSGKPWIANNICNEKGTNKSRVNGVSEESRFIINPSLLVAIEYPFAFSYPKDKNNVWCKDAANNMVPSKINYYPKKKEIVVRYVTLPFSTKNETFYQFNGINARDLGYEYMYVDKEKSTYKFDFAEKNNASNQVVQFRNFIHLGNSCRVKGGCNNGSPTQPLLDFKAGSDKYSTQQGKTIYIKLWKKRPNSPQDPADMTERIVLSWD